MGLFLSYPTKPQEAMEREAELVVDVFREEM
jgi:hypothetical protein